MRMGTESISPAGVCNGAHAREHEEHERDENLWTHHIEYTVSELACLGCIEAQPGDPFIKHYDK